MSVSLDLMWFDVKFHQQNWGWYMMIAFGYDSLRHGNKFGIHRVILAIETSENGAFNLAFTWWFSTILKWGENLDDLWLRKTPLAMWSVQWFHLVLFHPHNRYDRYDIFDIFVINRTICQVMPTNLSIVWGHHFGTPHCRSIFVW